MRKFIDKEIAPRHAQWEADGIVPCELWVKAGAAGMLCCTVPETYGGIAAVYLFDVVVFKEMARSGFSGPGFMIHCALVATKTDSSAGVKGVTQFLVDTHLPGVRRGKNLHKLGMKAQDTSELFFDEVRVPASAMLGEQDKGFELMMTKPAQERLAQAIRSAIVAETVVAHTVECTAQRKALGKAMATSRTPSSSWPS